MKTIGISCRRSVNSLWRSGPVMPGMATSRIRHLVRQTQSDARNSSADENASTAKPNSLSKSGKDSRTDSSSSTTDTSERMTITDSSSLAAQPSQQASERRQVCGRSSHHRARGESKMQTWLPDHHSVLPTDGRDDSR